MTPATAPSVRQDFDYPVRVFLTPRPGEAGDPVAITSPGRSPVTGVPITVRRRLLLISVDDESAIPRVGASVRVALALEGGEPDGYAVTVHRDGIVYLSVRSRGTPARVGVCLLESLTDEDLDRVEGCGVDLSALGAAS